jgi:hypothetical protein
MKTKIRTLSEFKALLTDSEDNNTLTGLQLISILRGNAVRSKDFKASTHLLEEAIEIFAQMGANGIDVFKDEYKMGSVTKAYHQWQVREYSNY